MFRKAKFIRYSALSLLLSLLYFSGSSAQVTNSLSYQELNVEVSAQQQTNWCWAAITTSLGKFYGLKNRMQCDLVDAEIDRDNSLNCCDKKYAAKCNQLYKITQALNKTGIKTTTRSGKQSFIELAQQIQDGHPVVLVMIGSGVADNHYILLTGVRANETLVIKDPIGGVTRSIPYAQFIQGYEQRFWKGSFFTQPVN